MTLGTFSTQDITNLSTEELTEHIANGTVNFIIHGLVAISPETFNAFKEEYGIGLISGSCVVDPISYEVAQNNNKKLAAYLTSLYGNDWKNKLPAQPFGL
ncbi:hypothetical protein [Gelidibacter salicanalis]|uniref:Uncharacterized protein n=1 Tax=Gelidibacter salicanalis TaxID=291193 RepID=A0A934KP61_9FLAO|nr:hypothetical protein [Gelidibacter salicanalis]MBJ7880884.1 hypothetical protein [Gelidibacter salicanalis]